MGKESGSSADQLTPEFSSELEREERQSRVLQIADAIMEVFGDTPFREVLSMAAKWARIGRKGGEKNG